MSKQYIPFCGKPAVHPCAFVSFLLSAYLMFSLPIYAQTPIIDSLAAVLRERESMGSNDTNIVNLLNKLSVEVLPSNLEQSFRYAKRAEEIATKISFPDGLALSCTNLGIALWKQGKLAPALDLHTKALTLLKLRLSKI
jgi:hypothetical protein